MCSVFSTKAIDKAMCKLCMVKDSDWASCSCISPQLSIAAQSELLCPVFYHTGLTLSGAAPAAEQSSTELPRDCGSAVILILTCGFIKIYMYCWPLISEWDLWCHFSGTFWIFVLAILGNS